LNSESSTPDTASRPTPGRRPRLLAYRWFWVVAAVTYSLDQYTKHWIAMRMPLGSYGPKHGITVMRNFFYLVHVGNTGAAWSMFSGMGSVLACLALGTLAAIFIWRHQLGLRTRLPQLCFGLLCGGTAGNLTDRLQHGYVTDFLDFHFGSYIYPTFNVADMGVIIGVFGYILWSLRQPAPASGC
jgi:signal peptidase II